MTENQKIAPVPNNPIYAAVLAALQPADEIGGVTGAAEYIEIMRAVAQVCEQRAETARANYYAEGGAFAIEMDPLPDDKAAFDAVLAMLSDNGGAVLYWQVADELRETADFMLDLGVIFMDWESDCLTHPDAVPRPDEHERSGPASFYIPHQDQR